MAIARHHSCVPQAAGVVENVGKLGGIRRYNHAAVAYTENVARSVKYMEEVHVGCRTAVVLAWIDFRPIIQSSANFRARCSVCNADRFAPRS